MTIKERVNDLVHNRAWNFCDEKEHANLEKMIVLAYYIGREEATKTVSDKYNAHIAEQHKRAENCRYHNMAMEVVGQEQYFYFPDYSGDMTEIFGNDLADI